MIILIVSFGSVAAENSTDGSSEAVDETTSVDDSSQDSDDESADVEFDLDVIYDEDEGNSTSNATADDAHSSHKISLNHHATSNPIFMALLVMIIASLIPLRRHK